MAAEKSGRPFTSVYLSQTFGYRVSAYMCVWVACRVRSRRSPVPLDGEGCVLATECTGSEPSTRVTLAAMPLRPQIAFSQVSFSPNCRTGDNAAPTEALLRRCHKTLTGLLGALGLWRGRLGVILLLSECTESCEEDVTAKTLDPRFNLCTCRHVSLTSFLHACTSETPVVFKAVSSLCHWTSTAACLR